MRTLILALVFLIVGAVGGGFLTLAFGTSMGLANGLVMGAQTGVCLAARAAQRQGITDPAALDALVDAAIDALRRDSAQPPEGSGMQWVEDLAGCAPLLANFPETPAQPTAR